jgi:hypothetical protein
LIKECKTTIRINKILCVYSASQTYTSAVFEHLKSFATHSQNSWFYLDVLEFDSNLITIDSYDSIVIHYSVRLPFGQLNEACQQRLRKFSGLKVLFIQDEYDGTNLVKKIINSIPFDLVFSVVPQKSLEKIYPKNEHPQTKFVTNLTGYVPEELVQEFKGVASPMQRPLIIGYRGRVLPLRYGRLGQEKSQIGYAVRNYCIAHQINFDIKCDEGSRLYGKKWYKFISSMRAMLGTESGANIFDWDSLLSQEIKDYQSRHPNSTHKETYLNLLRDREIDGLMNQVSPKIFEMAAAKTIMVLFEGEYSGVVEPHTHFLPLKKDFSNLGQIITLLKDNDLMNAMAERTYIDIIVSGKFSYRKFVRMVDGEMNSLILGLVKSNASSRTGVSVKKSKKITLLPIRYKRSALLKLMTILLGPRYIDVTKFIWMLLPAVIRPLIKKIVLKYL